MYLWFHMEDLSNFCTTDGHKLHGCRWFTRPQFRFITLSFNLGIISTSVRNQDLYHMAENEMYNLVYHLIHYIIVIQVFRTLTQFFQNQTKLNCKLKVYSVLWFKHFKNYKQLKCEHLKHRTLIIWPFINSLNVSYYGKKHTIQNNKHFQSIFSRR